MNGAVDHQPDLLEGTFYTEDPYSTYAWLREHDPVHWDATNNLWAISRYDDIVAIEKDKATFSNAGQADNGYRPGISSDPSIIGLDDPHHQVRRQLVARRFTPRAVSGLEDHVRQIVNELLDAALAKREVDIVGELAAPLPATMIGELLGFPHDMVRKLQEWSERTIVLGGGPRYFDEDGTLAAMEFAGACLELYTEKTGCPADDVMSLWIDHERTGLKDGQAFGVDQMISDCLLLLDGGAETTRTVIARTILNLMARPDQVAKLRDGADLTIAVEEFIRYVTPIHNMCRAATRDVEFGGKQIKQGDQLLLMYSSANRDPEQFDRPEEFDVTRDPNLHLAFGFGTHFCIGSNLARMEIRIFFEEFLRRVGSWAPVPGTAPVEMPNAFVYGLKEAMLVLDPA
jgi:cytochrome P450 family 142 subfamily A polypeptide 1